MTKQSIIPSKSRSATQFTAKTASSSQVVHKIAPLLPFTATKPPSQTVEVVLKYKRHRNDVSGVTPFKPTGSVKFNWLNRDQLKLERTTHDKWKRLINLIGTQQKLSTENGIMQVPWTKISKQKLTWQKNTNRGITIKPESKPIMMSSIESLFMSTDVRTFWPCDMAWDRLTSHRVSSTKLSQGSDRGTEFLGFQMLTLCTRVGKCDLAKKMTNPVSPW